MFRPRRAWLASLMVLVGCSSVGPSPGGTPSPEPGSAQPTSTVAPGTEIPTLPPRTPPPSFQPQPTATATTPPAMDLMVVTVLPAEDPVEVRPAIPGEKVCFLVQVDDRYIDDGEITFAATGDGVTIDSVPRAVPKPGGVAELWVTIGPHQGETQKTATVDLAVTHGGTSPATWVETRSIIVMPETDSRAEVAEQYFDFWVDWLATEHRELGITAKTTWDSTFVSMLLIVSKYAYWSDEWEMVVTWHEMIPPSDFTEVYLRRRSSEVRYSLAFRQESFSAGTPPGQINAPDALIR